MTEQGARDFLTALGAEIKYWRQRRGLTRPQLAKLVGVSDTTLGRIERGQTPTTAPDVWRIASVLDIPFSTMVRRAEESASLDGDGDEPTVL